MKTSIRDKALPIIVVSLVVLILLAIIIGLSRQPDLNYLPEETPAAIAYNYLLALYNEDYARAYSYLSPRITRYPPDLVSFFDMIESNSRRCLADEWTISVQSTDLFPPQDSERAVVTFQELHQEMGPGIFGPSSYVVTFAVKLRWEDGQWRIYQSDRCWYYRWN